MSEPTDADRERARAIVLAGDAGPESWTQILAAALAEERERARQVILAMSDDFQNHTVMASGWRIAEQIRRIAERNLSWPTLPPPTA